MTNRILFGLAEDWALGVDGNQWVVLRRRNFRTQCGWKPVAFVGSTKRILRRVLVEIGVVLTPEARDRLNDLPERFRNSTKVRLAEAS